MNSGALLGNLSPDKGLIGCAREYFRRGWAPICVPKGKKAPAMKDWPRFRIPSATLEG